MRDASQWQKHRPALLVKANAGDAEAQYQLGNAYNYGHKVRRDYSQALIWYRKGAEQGNADAEFQLGGLYHFGHGVPQDEALAFDWTMKAAEQGHMDAEFFISTCYGEGWGVAKDDAQEMAWLRKGAEQGHVNSQLFSGGRMRLASMASLRTTRKPISGWTLLHRERSHLKNGKRLSKDEMKPPCTCRQPNKHACKSGCGNGRRITLQKRIRNEDVEEGRSHRRVGLSGRGTRPMDSPPS